MVIKSLAKVRSTLSTQARKQRKARRKARLHLQQKFAHAHLSPDLRKKHGYRNVQLRKGDKVKVMRGQFRKKEDLVERVDLKREQVYVRGVELVKKDGSKVLYPLRASNLMITSLDLSDKKRKAKLQKTKTASTSAGSKVADKPVKSVKGDSN